MLRLGMFQRNRQKWLWRTTNAINVIVVSVVALILFLWNNHITPTIFQKLHIQYAGYPGTLDSSGKFYQDWCRIRESRLNWQTLLAPCADNTEWGKIQPRWANVNETDPEFSYISFSDIRPAGQFSRISIQSQDRYQRLKTIGGDSWRVHLKGPSHVSAHVYDLNNGTYEVIFLILEPGMYLVEAVLDYTVCTAFRDPPVDWFIKGNGQGKFQHFSTIGRNQDYYRKPLWGGAPYLINIPKPLLNYEGLGEFSPFFGSRNMCHTKCKLLWDGYGRWVNNEWKPYVKDVLPEHHPHHKEGVLWIYGDSVNVFFAQSLEKRKLCKEIFKQCNYTYNWIYPVSNYTRSVLYNDDLDYNNERVLNHLKAVLFSPLMDDKSAIIMNFGLHFAESTNFTNYQNLIQGIIKVLKETYVDSDGQERLKFPGRVIWKTTTAINKERLLQQHNVPKRYLTFPRVQLFNAYSSSVMCHAGIDVLDVYPMSDSYPAGTGTHGRTIKPNDVTHYSDWAFRSVEDLLEDYFTEKNQM